jgi:hypothetical protein
VVNKSPAQIMTNKLSVPAGAGMAIVLCLTSSILAKEKESGSPSPGESASPATAATSSAAGAASSPTKKNDALRFDGIISAVNQTAQTFSIPSKGKTQVFKITNRSVITIKTEGKFHVHFGDRKGTMIDVAKGQKASGSYRKNADSSLEVRSVKLDNHFVP